MGLESFMPFPEQFQRQVLDFSRACIRRALGVDRVVPVAGDEMRQPAGCFVSLHSLHGHRLRGCVGRIDATQPLATVLESVAAGVLRDPRFANAPVTAEELAWLEIEVSVLSPPRPVRSPLDFEPLKDGIYLTIGNNGGCFLPQVARETGWTREQLLDRLCIEKLGLPASTWRTLQARLSVFSVDVIGPEPFESSISDPIGKHPGHH
jgi:AmmeMemoRadiSam system protein A